MTAGWGEIEVPMDISSRRLALVQHRHLAERGLLSFLRLLSAFLLHVIKRNQAKKEDDKRRNSLQRRQFITVITHNDRHRSVYHSKERTLRQKQVDYATYAASILRDEHDKRRQMAIENTKWHFRICKRRRVNTKRRQQQKTHNYNRFFRGFVDCETRLRCRFRHPIPVSGIRSHQSCHYDSTPQW